MKPRHFVIAFAVFIALVCLAATTVRPGLKISQYPNNGFINSNALFITEKGDGSTNENISFGQLALRVTNSINASLSSFATTNYVNTATNALTNTIKLFASNLVVVLSGTNTLVSKTSTNGTNFYVVNADPFAITNGLASTNYANQVASNRVVVLSGTNILVEMTSTNGTNFYAVNNPQTAGFSSFETLTNATRVGLSTNNNWTFGVTGYVAGTTLNLGIDALAISNVIGIVSANAFETNQFTTNVAGTPVVGSLWFNGTNGLPGTNEARTGIEYIPFWRSLRAGQVAAGADVHGLVGNGSNYWNNTNIGPLSVGFGSNAFVKAAYSSVLGGSYNAILSNAVLSVIGGGNENLIDTNVSTSVIAGGGKNKILGTNATVAGGLGVSTIGGGSNNIIGGQLRWSTIGGGGDNIITSAAEATIAGGFGNEIRTDGRNGFIGGGNNNKIGAGSPAVADESQSSVVGGGSQNLVRGDYSFIGGGYQNNMIARGDDYCVIGGGQINVIGITPNNFSTHATISGGSSGLIENNSSWSVIAGGLRNIIRGNNTNSTISGGEDNVIEVNAPFGNILGGRDNYINGTGDYGTVGGYSNQLGALGAMVFGHNATNGTAHSVLIQSDSTNRFHVGPAASTNQGLLKVSNGRANANSSVGGIFTNVTTTVASAGAAETNLITVTIPAHSLTNNGDSFTFRTSGRFAATANAKDLKVVYGSETILDTSSQIVNSGAWTFEGEIIRTGNTSHSVNAEFHGAGVTLFTTAASLDLAQTNGINSVLKVTSTAAGDGDVTNRTMTVWLWPAP